ncbi:MAG: adenosine deaminase [Chitinophagaceae bacterium]
MRQLPKAELHLHLDCSLSYDVVSAIDPLVTREQYEVAFIAPPKCTDLADFLLRAPMGIALMQTKEHLGMVVRDLFQQLLADNVLYAEIRFAPLQHLDKGLTAYEVVAATESATAAAIAETGIEARLILCTLRHYTEAQSMETVHLVEQFKHTLVAGFDIAANEAGFPIDAHIKAFEFAKSNGIFCTAHAGEACGAPSVWETLEHFGPTRIGHGVRCIEDDRLVAHLKKYNIHLEVCPSSNLQTNMYHSYEKHPVDALYKAGISLSLSTDTRTITNITLNQEYVKMKQSFGWETADFFKCNMYALEAAFLPKKEKEKLMKKMTGKYNELISQLANELINSSHTKLLTSSKS